MYCTCFDLEDFLRKMTPKTWWLILNALLVHELLQVYNRMHHAMQALNLFPPSATKMVWVWVWVWALRRPDILWHGELPLAATTQKTRKNVAPGPDCVNRSVGVPITVSKGHTKVWKSVYSTQRATTKRGSPYAPFMGPHRSVGVRIPNSKGHTKVCEL